MLAAVSRNRTPTDLDGAIVHDLNLNPKFARSLEYLPSGHGMKLFSFSGGIVGVGKMLLVKALCATTRACTAYPPEALNTKPRKGFPQKPQPKEATEGTAAPHSTELRKP